MTTKHKDGTPEHKKATAKLNKQLKAARAKVNELDFGTDEWEAAMEVVREYCQQIQDMTDFGPYTSREGDVFSVQPSKIH